MTPALRVARFTINLMALLRFCCNGLGLQQFTRCQRATWQAAVRRMETAAFAPVPSYNPY